MNENDFRLELDNNGTLHIRGREGWQEPTCPICRNPIRWVLDMASFTTGPDHTYAHARCVWTPEAFEAEAQRVLPETPTGFELTGEYRPALPGEWAVDDDGNAYRYDGPGIVDRHILRKDAR